MEVINRLTENIDNYGDKSWIATEIHETLWDDLNDLRNFKPEHKENVMRDWIYKDAFDCTEKTHLNEKKIFEKMTWEESFCVAILFMHYH